MHAAKTVIVGNRDGRTAHKGSWFRKKAAIPLLAILTCAACVGSASGRHRAVSVAISPNTASVQVGLSQQFTATVSGSRNTAVNWLVAGVAGGNSSVGTISATG